MARTVAGAQLTVAHRQAQLVLRADVLADLTRLWTLFDHGDLEATFARFATAAEIIIRQRHGDSTGLAAAYFERFRAAEGAAGTAYAVLVEPPAPVLVRETLRVTGLDGVTAAVRAGQSAAQASRSGLVRVLGSATRLVLGGGRGTIVGSVRRDRETEGWQRVTSGSPCAFCAMVASRGPAYASQRSARFEAHDHCGCSAEPYYRGSRTLEVNARLAEAWQVAQREAADAGELSRGTSNDALNAFRRHLAGSGSSQ
ncbi:hypothetical protein AB0C02_30455 [Micromonospora sp. NPDC048999]|uniref:VG15 protein n=1 Tax=Micromonospora sp. NPDC048999 TaxID=3155391 RepID=UPI0033F5ABFE